MSGKVEFAHDSGWPYSAPSLSTESRHARRAWPTAEDHQWQMVIGACTDRLLGVEDLAFLIAHVRKARGFTVCGRRAPVSIDVIFLASDDLSQAGGHLAS